MIRARSPASLLLRGGSSSARSGLAGRGRIKSASAKSPGTPIVTPKPRFAPYLSPLTTPQLFTATKTLASPPHDTPPEVDSCFEPPTLRTTSGGGLQFSTHFSNHEPVLLHVEYGRDFAGIGLSKRYFHAGSADFLPPDSGNGGKKAETGGKKTSSSDEPSSKVEETVKRLRDKQMNRVKELTDAQHLEMKIQRLLKKEDALDKEKALAESKDEPKKALWTKVKDEVKHYYSGFKLLFLDVRISSKIIWKLLQGNNLTRRESKQLVRTVGDLFRLVPFSVFIIIPFMEVLLPVALKLFPGMLPSTFASASERQNKMRRTLKAKLEYARFLQTTLDEMAPTSKGARDSRSAKDFVQFYERVKKGEVSVQNEDIVRFSKLFEDDLTLDNMERSQLIALCRLLELTPIGTNNFLRMQLEMKVRQLKSDDRVIQREGISNLDVSELQSACRERGMRAYGLSEKALRHSLEQWLDLSLNANVPSSLLLLSRTLYLPENLDTKATLAATISALPESTAAQASAQIGELEGKVRNVVKLELIKEEQRKIEEEAIEEEVEKKRKEEVEKKKKQKEEEEELMATREVVEEVTGEVMKAAKAEGPVAAMALDKAKVANYVEEIVSEEKATDKLIKEAAAAISLPTSAEDVEQMLEKDLLVDKAIEIKDKDEKLSSEDVASLKSAIESLGKKTEDDLDAAEETVDDLKKELQDYEEDLEELRSIKEETDRLDLQESKGAQRLFAKVNRMLGKVDRQLEALEQKGEEQEVKVKVEVTGDEGEKKTKEAMVTIHELIEAVKQLKATSDASKLEQIASVLSHMDDDADGMVKVAHVMKVIELLGRENIELSAKQINKIIDMMEMEEEKEVEEDLTDVLAKSQPDEKAENVSDEKKSDFDEEEYAKEMFEKEEEDGKSDQGPKKQALECSPPKEKE